MNRQAIEKITEEIKGGFDSLSLFLMTDLKNPAQRLLKVKATNEAVPLLKKLIQNYLEVVLRKAEELGFDDLPLLDYDSDQWASTLSVEAVENWPLESTGKNDDFLKIKGMNTTRIRAWVIQLTVAAQKMLFFQRFLPAKMFKKKWINFVAQEDRFEPVTKPILSMSESFDCFSLGGELIISNLKNFEAIFRYDQVYKERSGQFVSEIAEGTFSDACKIENIELLSEKLLTNKNYNKKIYRIMQHKRYETIDFERLSTFVENHQMDLGADGSGGRIVVQENTPCELLLNVLNDDYSLFQITPYEYITEKKRELG